MSGTEARATRQQIYLVLAVTVVALIAATIGGLVAQWGYDASADLVALETASTVDVGAGDPPHPGLTPLSGAVPAFEQSGSIYVPVYSSVYVGNRRSLSNLAATLSIRNTAEDQELVVTRVDYFDGQGRLVRSLLDAPHGLAPMSTAEFFLDVDEPRGGPGANFLVTWGARAAISAPLVEAVMIGSYGLRSISIVSRGRELRTAP